MNTSSKTRRNNNEGTVPRQRKDGQWQSNYIAGYLPSGKAIRKSVYGSTRAKCAANLKAALLEVSDGTITLTQSPRLIEWLDHYLNVIAPNSIKERTINAHRSKVDNYIRGHRLAGKRLDKITPSDIDVLYQDARGSRKRANKSSKVTDPLSPSTIQGLHRILRRALNVAVNRGVLVRNPVLRVEVSGKSDFEPQVYMTDEVRQMLALAVDMDDGARWILNLTLGPRQGEALGFAWPDIDFEKSTIKLSREVYSLPWKHGCGGVAGSAGACVYKSAWRCPERHGGGFFTGPPKSAAGYRTLPIPTQLSAALKEHREVQRLQRSRDWAPYVDQAGKSHELVFCKPNGQPTDHRADWQAWKDFLAAANVPDGRVHDGRHTAATTLLLLGVEQRVVMDILGWSQSSMLTRYQHVLDEMRDDVATKLSNHWTPEPEPESNVISLADVRKQRLSGGA
ncbi:tyrosine-type recombinase/integrase [Glutamicibacter ardleyensis]|uniref:Site-specific integrase n=1 Tax=Glutamicibacter ardleyensis TaxID=225894 RepID=A0ABQ2DVL1_9MICC|nr:site-specific integrase [Glutamicibacter ardleyensis]GGJ74603.1 site-specific integrase [Glutamicibacter ardleyensis]